MKVKTLVMDITKVSRLQIGADIYVQDQRWQ